MDWKRLDMGESLVARPLRVAFVVNFFPELSQTFVLNQLEFLVGAGVEVDVIARSPGSFPPDRRTGDSDGGSREVRYAPLPDSGVARLRWAAHHLISDGRRFPKQVLGSLNIGRYGKEAARLRVLGDVIANLPPRDYDVVYCHFGQAGLVASRLSALGVLRGPIVTVFHGSDVSDFIQSQGVDVYQELFAVASLCLPVSEHWAVRLKELGCPPGKIRVHRMGVDPSPSGPDREHRRDDDGVRLLTVARLVEKKGLEYALEALSLMRGHNVRYTIAGDGPLMEPLKAQRDALGLAGRVTFLGRVAPDEVQGLLDTHDVFVAPSVTGSDGNKEGIPVAIMEAMDAHLPVVSTWHSGIPELVAHNESGLLAPERDAPALARAFERLTDPQLRTSMGRQGKRIIERSFNQNILNGELLRLLETVAAR